MRVPGLIIAGAPKSGTTALSDYLGDHPAIFMARKESHYFATDLCERGVKTMLEYKELFKQVQGCHQIAGEASVYYLMSREAVPNILKHNPNARIVTMLRNPVDVVQAQHAQMVYNCEEDQPTLESAWNLQDARAHGRHLPRHTVDPGFVQYRRIGMFGEQVARLIKIVPRDQLHFIVFDDFVNDPQAVFERVLEFLNIDSDGRSEFPRINANKRHRNRLVGLLLTKPPHVAREFVWKLEEQFGVENLPPIKWLRQWNTIEEPRQTVSGDLLRRIARSFESDIDTLQRLINRDLSEWIRRYE